MDITIYDKGTVSVTVNEVTALTRYGEGSTAATIASGLASALSSASNTPVSVKVDGDGSSLNITALQPSAASNYGFSSNVAYDTTDFSSASFTYSDSVMEIWSFSYDELNRLSGATLSQQGQSLHKLLLELRFLWE